MEEGEERGNEGRGQKGKEEKGGDPNGSFITIYVRNRKKIPCLKPFHHGAHQHGRAGAPKHVKTALLTLTVKSALPLFKSVQQQALQIYPENILLIHNIQGKSFVEAVKMVQIYA